MKAPAFFFLVAEETIRAQENARVTLMAEEGDGRVCIWVFSSGPFPSSVTVAPRRRW